MRRNPASFRDPSGYVLEDADMVYRVVDEACENDWTALSESGLYDLLRGAGVLPFEVLAREEWPDVPDTTIAVLVSPRVPFISYPYEWSFSQLREAALQTLLLQIEAVKRNFILKDATAYNVQFMDGEPVFIDLLSFEPWPEGRPWDAYGQFCSHFLAPLALESLRNPLLGVLSRQWIDGVPIELASQLLPLSSKLSPGLAMHIHMHAAMRRKHAPTDSNSVSSAKNSKMGKRQLLDVAESLQRTVAALKPPAMSTEWGDYYTDTNYSPAAREAKEKFVAEAGKRFSGRLALDLGANNGSFSRLLAPHFDLVLATDADHVAVDSHWRQAKNPKVLPLILDLASPSPDIGWACGERQSFMNRCDADFISALALCHHLRITAGIPLQKMAEGIKAFAKAGARIMIEFVPREDSQTQRLLSRRDDVFADYNAENFITSFEEAGLRHMESYSLPESERVMHIFENI